MGKPALVDTYAQLPIDVVEAHGARLKLRDGRELWDFYGGHAVAVLGHSHPAVAAALADQAQRLAFYSNVLALDIRTRAAETLCRFASNLGPRAAPVGLEHVFFCNSGAEANENALKLAIQHTGRKRIAMLDGGWHGRTLLALSATTEEKLRAPLEPLLVPSVCLRPNAVEDLARLDESVAAIIVEPILSIAGVVELSGDYLRALRRRCDEVGCYLIYDEVQTGVGRLGRPYVAGDFGVCPDLATSAKGLANGVPMGAVLMTSRVADQVKSGDLGSTFGGGPLACAALLAVIDTIERDRLCAHAETLGREMHARLRVGPVQQVLGRGCLIGLRVGGSAKVVHQQLLSAGFVTGTSADPCVLRLMPPISLPLEAVRELALALAQLGEVAYATLA
ncbi:MAG: aspartate aminotransferase family protein [Phycisphaerae bacterium]